MSDKAYEVLQEKEKALLVKTLKTKLVGWIPKLNGKGEKITDAEACSIVNRHGVPEKIYACKGFTSRQTLVKEVKFENLHYDDKNNIVILKDGKETSIARSYVERPDMLHKSLFLPARYADKMGFSEGKSFYLTTRSMQFEVNKHFANLNKEYEKENKDKKVSNPKKVKGR